MLNRRNFIYFVLKPFKYFYYWNTLLRALLFVLLVLLFGVFVSCKETKYVPSGDYLLVKNKVNVNNKDIDKDELATYIKQKPNRKILGFFRLHLWAYNFLNRLKLSKPGNVIGEEPVLYDDYLRKKSIRQLSFYLNSKGFYNNVISTKYYNPNNRKIVIIYDVDVGEPYRINEINYKTNDSILINHIKADAANILKKNSVFSIDLLEDERGRIERKLKNTGYYYFSKEYIHFKVDTTLGGNKVDLNLQVNENYREVSEDIFVREKHVPQTIKRIYIFTEYDQRLALKQGQDYLIGFDTLQVGDFYYMYKNELKLKPEVIERMIHVKPDSLYRISDVENTYKYLSVLKQFKSINIRFEISKENEDIPQNTLDCYIYLSPVIKQSVTVELEGANSSANIGTGVNFIYNNKNLFGGAEIFDVKLSGALQAQKTVVGEDTKERLYNTIEYGTEANLHIPKFIVPFDIDKFEKKYKPNTNFNIAYNYQNRPDYTRVLTTGIFGYNWKGSKIGTHRFNPVELNTILLKDTTTTFMNSIRNTPLESGYDNFFISSSSYNFSFNTQDYSKKKDFLYINMNVETSGNLMGLYYEIESKSNTEKRHTFFGREYSQYLKTDIDFRIYNYLSAKQSIVFRVFGGLGLPYGNSETMPFVKQYYAGGANDIRAWEVRSLGPGSFEPVLSSYNNQTGDLKLEANVEYRFDLFWMFEGAFFIDAGNIWAVNKSESPEVALFKLNNFYNQIAVGTGIGARLDFDFFIFRFDLGIKVLDPTKSEGNRFVLPKSKFSKLRVFNVGIGYPF